MNSESFNVKRFTGAVEFPEQELQLRVKQVGLVSEVKTARELPFSKGNYFIRGPIPLDWIRL